MNGEEHGMPVWQAGDIVSTGTYLRVNNDSFRVIVVEQEGRLPASYDGHIALYCRASLPCSMNPQPGKSGPLNQE